ncbi:MAG: argininosuccinate synthase [Candidatus Omnitrophota bacterium]
MAKVVLAYSGGLDTSVCVKWLKEKYNLDVICYTADVGQGVNASVLKHRAKAAGAAKIYIETKHEEFAEDYVLPALKANALYEGGYLLATALSRPLIAKHLVDVAKKEKAGYVAHGCTGKGNDQVRIEVSAGILAPGLKVIAPLRIWELQSRNEEIDYAAKHKIPIDVTKKSPYSIDKNLWGISIECGALEDPWKEPPKNAYQLTKDPHDTPDKAEYVQVYFEGGTPKKLNGKSLKLVSLIAALNKIGAKHGIGRSDMVEDRLVGIKSREIYEAPAAWILYLAHKELEALVLDREVLQFKELISQKYAALIYNGLWFTPLKSALDKFIDQTQKNVTGSVKIKLYKGKATPLGRKSRFSLYKKSLATYEKGGKFDQKLAEGFIKIWGLPYEKTLGRKV